MPEALQHPVGIAIKNGKGCPAFQRSDGTTSWLPDPVASERQLAEEQLTNEGLRGELTKFQAQMDMMFVVRMLDDWSYEVQLSYTVPALRFVQMLLHEGADISYQREHRAQPRAGDASLGRDRAFRRRRRGRVPPPPGTTCPTPQESSC